MPIYGCVCCVCVCVCGSCGVTREDSICNICSSTWYSVKSLITMNLCSFNRVSILHKMSWHWPLLNETTTVVFSILYKNGQCLHLPSNSTQCSLLEPFVYLAIGCCQMSGSSSCTTTVQWIVGHISTEWDGTVRTHVRTYLCTRAVCTYMCTYMANGSNPWILRQPDQVNKTETYYVSTTCTDNVCITYIRTYSAIVHACTCMYDWRSALKHGLSITLTMCWRCE